MDPFTQETTWRFKIYISKSKTKYHFIIVYLIKETFHNLLDDVKIASTNVFDADWKSA